MQVCLEPNQARPHQRCSASKIHLRYSRKRVVRGRRAWLRRGRAHGSQECGASFRRLARKIALDSSRLRRAGSPCACKLHEPVPSAAECGPCVPTSFEKQPDAAIPNKSTAVSDRALCGLLCSNQATDW